MPRPLAHANEWMVTQFTEGRTTRRGAVGVTETAQGKLVKEKEEKAWDTSLRTPT